MTENTQKTIYLKDYTPPPYLVDSVDLRVELDPASTLVRSRLAMRPNPAFTGSRQCILDGEHLELVGVKLDREPLSADQYRFDQGKLHIFQVPDEPFILELETRINPAANTALEGLYLSRGNYCTQCEAEGFRRITCFPDRPDVMAVYTTTVVAEKGPARRWCCSPTATWWSRASWKTDAGLPPGTIPFPSPVTFLPWWPAA
ncbi:hypothetical protein GF1_18480 [Desulfolithobacter dissulfuricans]|uniref:Aminopeptidase N n=1 Tax=Desulfolithobacter dissulfuricans TaxID=2795293 RepID=A0A915U5T5_9BACT|nr:hypothetical protein [Desulfolithobacter dissulfuricans]BCO09472.1 hypothetical protein GF1_18480 [Desulfolithobacter dissulfuricans]